MFPSLLLSDEPTSGLDSAAASQVCDGLLSIARQGKVVCAVIHSPRWEIFSQFEDVLLLGRGGIPIFFGPVREVRDFFSAMGFIPPPNCNPADFYLDIISEESFLHQWQTLGGFHGLQRLAVQEGRSVQTVRLHLEAEREEPIGDQSRGAHLSLSKPQEEISSMGTIDMPTALAGQASTTVDQDVHSNSSSEVRHDSNGASKQLGGYTSHTPIVPNQPASFWSQVYHLTYRNLLVDCRNGRNVGIDCLLQIIPAVGLGINFLDDDEYYSPLPAPVAETCIRMIGKRCDEYLTSMYSLTSPSFFYTMIIAVASVLWSVNTFGRTMTIYFRDRISGTNSTAYFISKILYDFIHWFRMTFIFISIFYLMATPRSSWGYWFATISGTFWAGMGVSYLVSILIPLQRAPAIAVVTVVSMAVTSGLSPSLDVVSNWNILRFFWYVSYNRWAAEAFVIMDASGQPTNGRMDRIITATGFDPANLDIDIAIVFMIGIVWRILAYIALLRAKPRTEF